MTSALIIILSFVIVLTAHSVGDFNEKGQFDLADDETNLKNVNKESNVRLIRDDSDEKPIVAKNSPTRVVNFASDAAGAVVLASSDECSGFSNILSDDRDKYAKCPCAASKKWVTIGLSEDILVTSLILKSLEKYSSTIASFSLLGSLSYPTTEWVDLGTFDVPMDSSGGAGGADKFAIEHPAWVRYLKLRFLTFYGNEYFCTVTQVLVQGNTVLESFKHEMQRGEEEFRNLQSAVQSAAEEVSRPTDSDLLESGKIDEIVNITGIVNASSVSSGDEGVLNGVDNGEVPTVVPGSSIAEAGISVSVETATVLPNVEHVAVNISEVLPQAVIVSEPIDIPVNVSEGNDASSVGSVQINASVDTFAPVDFNEQDAVSTEDVVITIAVTEPSDNRSNVWSGVENKLTGNTTLSFADGEGVVSETVDAINESNAVPADNNKKPKIDLLGKVMSVLGISSAKTVETTGTAEKSALKGSGAEGAFISDGDKEDLNVAADKESAGNVKKVLEVSAMENVEGFVVSDNSTSIASSEVSSATISTASSMEDVKSKSVLEQELKSDELIDKSTRTTDEPEVLVSNRSSAEFESEKRSANRTSVDLEVDFPGPSMANISNGVVSRDPCGDIMKFSAFQAKMMLKLNMSTITQDISSLSSVSSLIDDNGISAGNVFRSLMQRIKSMEVKYVILELYAAQLAECYASLSNDFVMTNEFGGQVGVHLGKIMQDRALQAEFGLPFDVFGNFSALFKEMNGEEIAGLLAALKEAEIVVPVNVTDPARLGNSMTESSVLKVLRGLLFYGPRVYVRFSKFIVSLLGGSDVIIATIFLISIAILLSNNSHIIKRFAPKGSVDLLGRIPNTPYGMSAEQPMNEAHSPYSLSQEVLDTRSTPVTTRVSPRNALRSRSASTA